MVWHVHACSGLTPFFDGSVAGLHFFVFVSTPPFVSSFRRKDLFVLERSGGHKSVILATLCVVIFSFCDSLYLFGSQTMELLGQLPTTWKQVGALVDDSVKVQLMLNIVIHVANPNAALRHAHVHACVCVTVCG